VFSLELCGSSQEVLDNIGLGGPIKHLDTALGLNGGCWWLCCLDFGFRKKMDGSSQMPKFIGNFHRHVDVFVDVCVDWVDVGNTYTQ
jgi:hypothetical protein